KREFSQNTTQKVGLITVFNKSHIDFRGRITTILVNETPSVSTFLPISSPCARERAQIQERFDGHAPVRVEINLDAAPYGLCDPLQFIRPIRVRPISWLWPGKNLPPSPVQNRTHVGI